MLLNASSWGEMQGSMPTPRSVFFYPVQGCLMRFPPLFVFFAVLLLLLMTSAAFPAEKDNVPTQTPPSTSTGFIFSDQITVHATTPPSPQSIFDIPAFVTEITLPDQPQLAILPEILSSSVGVNVKDFGGLGQLSTLSIRGSSANQVLVLLDGIRLTDPSQSGLNLATVSLANIEKIEVLRGADSAMYGDGAFGGVVNLLTRSDPTTPLTGTASITYGSFATLDTQIGSTISRETHQIHLALFRRHSDGDYGFTNDYGTPENPTDDFDDVRRNNKATSWGGNLVWRFLPTSLWTIRASLDAFFSDKGSPGIVTFPSDHAFQADDRYSGTVRIDRRNLPFLESTLSLEIFGRKSTLEFRDPYGEQIGVPVFTHQVGRGSGARASWRFGHLYGLGYVALESTRDDLDDIDFGQPSRSTHSLSIRDDLAFFSEALWITPAVRLDDVSEMKLHVSPKIGIKAMLTDTLSIKSNAGTAFRSPSFDELYLNMGFISGNPDLEPEKTTSIDLGLTWESPSVRFETVAFQSDSHDLIQYLLISGYRYKPFNIGRSRSRGIEFSSSLDLGADVNLSMSYTWMDVTDRTDDPNYSGRTLPGKPEHDLFARLDWKHSMVQPFIEYRYISGNYLTRANTQSLNPRETMNLGVSFHVVSHVQLGFEIRNALNQDIVDIRGFPLPPRMFTGTLSVRI